MKKVKIMLTLAIILLIAGSGKCFASEKEELQVPRVRNTSLEYIEGLQSPTLIGFDSELMEVSGNVAKEIGKYTITFELKDKENFEWEIYDETNSIYTYTTENQEVEWEITTRKLRIPNLEFEYTGKEITPRLDFYAYADEVNITSEKEKDIGTYNAILSLKDKEHYEWKVYNGDNKTYTYTTEDQDIEWSIIRQKVRIPKISIEYTGKEMKLVLDQKLEDKIEVVDSEVGLDSGKYSATLSLKDKENYAWYIPVYNESGISFNGIETVEDQDVEWEIVKRKIEILNRLYSSSQRKLQLGEYTGKEQELKLEDIFKESSLEDAKKACIMIGNTATNAGTYTAIISIRDENNYIFNTEEDSLTIEYEIEKSKICISDKRNFSSEYDKDGKEQELLLSEIVNENDMDKISVSQKTAKYIGSYTIVFSIRDKKNYMWKVYDTAKNEYIYTTDDQEVVWEITKIRKDLPILEYYFNGNEIEAKSDNENEFKVIDSDKGIEVGKYEASVELKDKIHMEWKVDNNGETIYTNQNQKIEWKIMKYIPTIYKSSQRKLYKIYNGKEQTIELKEIMGNLPTEDLITVTGNTARNIGKYEMTIYVNDDKNSDKIMVYDEKNNVKSSYVIRLEWEILKNELIELPELLRTEYRYNYGETIIPKYKVDTDYCSVKYSNANEVGTYEIIFSLKDKLNNQWVDGTNEDKIYTWKIVPLTLKRPQQLLPAIYDGNETEANLIGFDEKIMNITENKSIEIGDYTAKVSLKDTKNYIWDTGTSDIQDVKWSIEKDLQLKEKIQIDISHVSGRGYVYDNQEHTFEFLGDNSGMIIINGVKYSIEDTSKYYTISFGEKQKEIGIYYAELSLNDSDNFEWKVRTGVGDYDYTVENQKISWKIMKNSPIIYSSSQKKLNRTYNGKEQKIDISEIFAGYVCEDLLNISGNTATKPGTYILKISVKDLERCQKICILKSGDNNVEYVDEISIEWQIIDSTPTKPSGGGSGGGGSSVSGSKYALKVNKTAGGNISVKNEKGGSKICKITPDDGYLIVDVKVNGKSIGAVSTYTLESLGEDVTIEAEFAKIGTVEEKWNNPYEDLSEKDWYYQAVEFVSKMGVFKGVTEKDFGPNVNMNRVMIVTVLNRLAGEVKALNGELKFSDISSEQYYSNAVMWAVENGIINGVTESKFAPQNNITREQLVVMLYRYEKENGIVEEENVSLSDYDDNEMISDYARDAFGWAIKRGIITGRTNSILAPQGFATRAEVAMMIMRFCNIVPNLT